MATMSDTSNPVTATASRTDTGGSPSLWAMVSAWWTAANTATEQRHHNHRQ
jgi:hypothetical protein